MFIAIEYAEPNDEFALEAGWSVGLTIMANCAPHVVDTVVGIYVEPDSIIVGQDKKASPGAQDGLSMALRNCDVHIWKDSFGPYCEE